MGKVGKVVWLLPAAFLEVQHRAEGQAGGGAAGRARRAALAAAGWPLESFLFRWYSLIDRLPFPFVSFIPVGWFGF